MHVSGGPASPQVTTLGARGRATCGTSSWRSGVRGARGRQPRRAWRGRDFRKVTQLALGVRESQDQIDAARWAAARPWADPRRIGMWGWSYGGYMTALSLARGGDVFKAGIAVAPVVDWRFYDTIYTERFMRTPAENARGYQSSAVATYAPGMTARLLLVHGTGDDNVHAQNALVLAQTLQQLDKPFTMLLYPNKTHSIAGGRTQVHLFGALTRFLSPRACDARGALARPARACGGRRARRVGAPAAARTGGAPRAAALRRRCALRPVSGAARARRRRPPRGRARAPSARSTAETSRYADVAAFLDTLGVAPGVVRVSSMGADQPRGRRSRVIASRPAVARPPEGRTAGSGRPRGVPAGHIHAGEVEGKEAVQMLLATSHSTRGPTCSTRSCWWRCRSTTPTATSGSDRRRGPLEQNGPSWWASVPTRRGSTSTATT
jgi:dienelactone hydrolase